MSEKVIIASVNKADRNEFNSLAKHLGLTQAEALHYMMEYLQGDQKAAFEQFVELTKPKASADIEEGGIESP
jgi:hypothetical protein